jgi:hypothetical protein
MSKPERSEPWSCSFAYPERRVSYRDTFFALEAANPASLSA